MSHTRTKDYDKPEAPAEKQDSADQTAVEKRASDHRDQIRSVAHAAVQAMVNSNRAK